MLNLNKMKMGAGLFWGALLLLLGIALIVKVVFNVDFPVFKVVIGIFFIVIGLRVLLGRVGSSNINMGPENTMFNERVYAHPEKGKEYSVIFGNGIYDFTEVDLSEGDFNTKISTVFGGTVIKIRRDMPVKIEADAVFAGAELPEGNTAVFGSAIYATDSYSADSSALRIKVDVVFGGVQVIRK